jgi:hypothetical protein
VATLRIKDVQSVTIKSLRNKTRVQLILQASDSSRYDAIQIDLEKLLALAVAAEMKELLATDGASARPGHGAAAARTKLRVMK